MGFLIHFRFLPERFPRVPEGFSDTSGSGELISGHFRLGDVMVTWGECCSVIGYGPDELLLLLPSSRTKFFPQSRNPDGYFGHPASRAYFQSRIPPSFCLRIPNPGRPEKTYRGPSYKKGCLEGVHKF